ncbi:hypothetical protein GZH53_10975 [Flavihumibacter sp. R14]|nr:hypothetical protein [Flavihumibacter soli]
MKTIRVIIVLILLSPALVWAQANKYTAAMQKSLETLKSAKTADEMLAVANQFERIANAERTEWLPLYYASYANLLGGIITTDNMKKDPLFDKAMKGVKDAAAISADNSEIYTLLGYITFMKMTVDPQSRAMQMIGPANEALAKAKALDPLNPRPDLVSGQNTFYTPEAFGGGKERAKPLLETAMAKYEKFQAGDPVSPDWGKERCRALLEMCK